MQPTDPSQNNVKRLKVALLLIFVLIVAISAFSIYNALRFRVVSTNPAVNKIAASTPFLKVTFSKALSSRSLSVNGSEDAVKSFSAKGKTLTISFNYPLRVNQMYTITIASIRSQSGSQITNKQFTFTTLNTPVNELPGDQQKAIIGNQDHFSAAQKDPILVHLPYSTLDFSLNPTFTTGQNGQQQLVLQAQLLLAPGVSGSEAASDHAQYKQEVLNYIQSLGLNPADYTIQYQVVNETLTGP